MDRLIHESDVEYSLHGEHVEKVVWDFSDGSVVSDDDIPWGEIIAESRSGERGCAFDPSDLLKWVEEDEDEE